MIIFCPFRRFFVLTTQIIKILKKWRKKKKKTPGDIIILHMCTINDNHMMNGSLDMECNEHNFLWFLTVFLPFYHPNNPENMIYDSWDMERNGQNFLSFWIIFCPFPPPKNLKNQNFEKIKKMCWDIIILHKCTKNHDQICYTVPEIQFAADVIYIFHFGLFFVLVPKKSRFLNTEKNTWRYHHFNTCAPKIMIIWCINPNLVVFLGVYFENGGGKINPLL